MEAIATGMSELQGQLANAHAKITAQQGALQETQRQLGAATQELARINQLPHSTTNKNIPQVQLNKPPPYCGKGSITSWVTHMSNYLQNTTEPQAFAVAVSYLSEGAHEWWIVYKGTHEGSSVKTWPELKNALVSRFDTLNKEKVARDKLAKWKQLRDVVSFNEDFLKIILDIPNISIEEQIDRYTRGLKAYIWKDLCTNEYTRLADAMKDAERIESAHKRNATPRKFEGRPTIATSARPTPMEIGNIKLQKLTKEEREDCMKKGLCLRCRQKGHLAKHCPKGRRN